MVLLRRPRPWSLDPVLAVFLEGASRSFTDRNAPLMDFITPSESSRRSLALRLQTRRPVTRPPPEGDSPRSLAGVGHHSARRPRVQVDSKRPARYTTGPLKVTSSFELLSRGSSAPSTHQDGCVHSLTSKLARAAALPAASFRPRRFNGLDGLLRNPSPSGFPRPTLMGFRPPSRDSRLARTAPLPARPSPLELDDPALPSQSLPFTPDHRSFRGLLLKATVIAYIRFPSCKDSSPSWASLCGTSFARLPRSPKGARTATARSVPSRVPNCERASRPAR